MRGVEHAALSEWVRKNLKGTSFVSSPHYVTNKGERESRHQIKRDLSLIVTSTAGLRAG
jgi:hypothetical protein